jgi:hypothetical protein
MLFVITSTINPGGQESVSLRIHVHVHTHRHSSGQETREECAVVVVSEPFLSNA